MILHIIFAFPEVAIAERILRAALFLRIVSHL